MKISRGVSTGLLVAGVVGKIERGDSDSRGTGVIGYAAGERGVLLWKGVSTVGTRFFCMMYRGSSDDEFDVSTVCTGFIGVLFGGDCEEWVLYFFCW